MTTDTTVELIGPLQLRVMNHLWKVGSGTVQQVADVLNNAPGHKGLAYTTYLTVMRNLAKRKLLDQRKTDGKRHEFHVLVGEHEYKAAVVRQIVTSYCNDDRATLEQYLSGHLKQAG